MSLLVDRVIAPYFETNCWIVADRSSGEAIVVDPGIDLPHLADRIVGKLKEHHLRAIGIFITHGHLDHTFSLIPLVEAENIPMTYLHKSDRDLIVQPQLAMGEQGLAMMAKLLLANPGFSFQEPGKVREIDDGEEFVFAGLNISIIHTPGHTPGSLCARINDEILITGDTLFAGSIGRTDLPRGSSSDMARTLREKIAPLPGHLRVLPGHGRETRLEHEMESNPYLLRALSGESL